MVVLAYDHRAYELMQGIKEYLQSKKIEFIEFASKIYDAKDSYSEFTKKANDYILTHDGTCGIYSCRSGVGVCMMANRSRGIRAGVCQNEQITFLARNDDDINVLILQAEIITIDSAKSIIDKFLNTPFEGGRHLARLQLLDQ